MDILHQFPEAPPHLSPETRVWWRELAECYDFADHQWRILTAACEAWDSYTSCMQVVRDKGVSCPNRFGELRENPLLPAARKERDSFLRAMRELALDVNPPAETPRPPRIGGWKR